MAGDSGTDAGPQETLPPTWAVENASLIRAGVQLDDEPIATADPRLRTITRTRRGALALHVDLSVGILIFAGVRRRRRNSWY
jgi:hypothetical protein